MATLVAGRYELGPTLGRGGMADVHVGHDRRLGREVAVKVLRSDLARDPTFRTRFEREAQHVAGLNHPGIVAVYDTGELATGECALPYIVMEYVGGSTLRELLHTEGPLGAERACTVMIEACRALAFSHRHGIVHRDVKPANIMITTDGAIKVMDFGIARAIAQTQTGLTAAESVIGTAQYLSPEQGLGKSVDARSDVYAGGCVLHELLTGDPPFTGESPVAIVYQHVREDAPLPSELVRGVPPGLDAVVRRALAKNPDNRYDTADDLADDLERVLAGRRPLAPAVLGALDETTASLAPTTPPAGTDLDDRRNGPAGAPATGAHALPTAPKRRGRLVAAVLVLAALVAAGIWWFGPGAHADVPVVVGQQQTDAEHAVDAAGLVPVVAGVPSTPDLLGKVLDSTPPAGSSLDRHATVTLRVGRGPGIATVPSLTGRSPEAARQAAEAAGLTLTPVPKLRETNDPSKVGTVVDQDPSPGAMRPPGTAVALTIGQRPQTLNVPDVAGKDRAAAETSLEGVGLTVTPREVDSPTTAGTVVGTTPGAGSTVAVGSAVTMLVSRGTPTTVAPTAAPTTTPSTGSGSSSSGSGSGSGSSGSDGGGSGAGGGGLFPDGVFGDG